MPISGSGLADYVERECTSACRQFTWQPTSGVTGTCCHTGAMRKMRILDSERTPGRGSETGGVMGMGEGREQERGTWAGAKINAWSKGNREK